MITQDCQIDSQGRITLPKPAFDLLGFLPNMSVMVELTKSCIVIKPKPDLPHLPPITAEIAKMDLPVADWEQESKL
jgi:bifunctional DNA-binding transcriptional regulator/antitoxin component of YhaV-PrlF toxin-antitoxin module